MTDAVPRFPTSLGASSPDTITLLGQDLATDLMGKVSFGELALWLVTQRRPAAGQVRVFEAVLVALADHGFTPTAIAARLTYLSAPDSVQGALAAGLLGGGSRFLGVTEDAGRFLAAALAGQPVPSDDAGYDALALAAVTRARAAGQFVPGLGHPVHRVTDPRTPALIQIASNSRRCGPCSPSSVAIWISAGVRGSVTLCTGWPRPGTNWPAARAPVTAARASAS